MEPEQTLDNVEETQAPSAWVPEESAPSEEGPLENDLIAQEDMV